MEHRSNASSRSLVVEELIRGNALSQTELIRRTGLARTTVSGVIGGLLRDGLAEQVVGTSLRGRPPALVSLVDPSGYVAGVDIGHSHVSVAVASNGVVVDERTTPYASDDSGTNALVTAVEMLRAVVDSNGMRAIGAVSIGVPGPLGRGPDGTVRAGGVMSGWKDVDPAAPFRELFGKKTAISLDNDAHLAAIAEREHGALRGVGCSVFVKIASGVGSAVMIDGLVHHGAHGIAGELGHVRVVEHGEMCRCGGRGCLETVASLDFALRTLAPVHGSMSISYFPSLLAHHDPWTLRLFDEMGDAVGRALAPVISVLDPDVVAIGLPWAIESPITAAARRSIARGTQPFVARRVRVRAGEVGERGSLLGAIARASRLMKASIAK